MAVFIIDACALINLANCGLASSVIDAIGGNVCCQGLVEDELHDRSRELQELFDLRKVSIIPGDIPANDVSEIVQKNRIGLGEAECIAFCERFGWSFISDDYKARNVASKIIGLNRVVGTIGLLCACIDEGLFSASDACNLLDRARAAGGFLPNYDFSQRRIQASS